MAKIIYIKPLDKIDKQHLKTLNTEFGELCTQVGKIEGRLEEGFGAIKSNLKFIERKFDTLPCPKHENLMMKNLELINKNLNKISTMEGREWAWNKMRYILAAAISGGVITAIFAYSKEILSLLGI